MFNGSSALGRGMRLASNYTRDQDKTDIKDASRLPRGVLESPYLEVVKDM